MANPLRGYVRQHGYVAILLMGFVVFHLLLLSVVEARKTTPWFESR